MNFRDLHPESSDTEESDLSSAESTASKHADGKPKRPMGAYFLWLKDNRDRIFKVHSSKGNLNRHGGSMKRKNAILGATNVQAGKEWKALSDEEKRPYVEHAEELKAEYKAAMEAYNAK